MGWREIALAWIVAAVVVCVVLLLPRYGIERGDPVLSGPVPATRPAQMQNADPDSDVNADANDHDNCPNRDDQDGDC
jgi:hypothetical protein